MKSAACASSGWSDLLAESEVRRASLEKSEE